MAKQFANHENASIFVIVIDLEASEVQEVFSTDNMQAAQAKEEGDMNSSQMTLYSIQQIYKLSNKPVELLVFMPFERDETDPHKPFKEPDKAQLKVDIVRKWLNTMDLNHKVIAVTSNQLYLKLGMLIAGTAEKVLIYELEGNQNKLDAEALSSVEANVVRHTATFKTLTTWLEWVKENSKLCMLNFLHINFILLSFTLESCLNRYV